MMMKSTHPYQQERGAVIVFLALILVVILGFTALTIDVGRALDESRRLQIAADAGVLAGAEVLGAGGTMAAITQEVCSLGVANGIASSDVLSVQCGTWASGSFSAACTSTCAGLSTCTGCSGVGVNAVRAVNQRQIGTTFARVLNINSLAPMVEAIAQVPANVSTGCMRPFGIEAAVLGSPQITVGNTFTVGKNSPGNWGKLDVNGINMSSSPNFISAMQSGICHSSVTVGGIQPVGTGFGGNLSTGFNYVLNQSFIIPMVSAFPNGNSGAVTILEFVRVRYLGDNGISGNNWIGTLRLEERNATPPSLLSGASGDPVLTR